MTSSQFPQEEQARLRAKAATVLHQAGQLDEAISLASRAGSWGLARDLILQRAEAVLGEGKRATFIDWCAKLPPVEMNAWLLEAIDEVANGLAEKQLPNSEFFIESAGDWVSANISLLPLLDARRRPLGFMLVMENLERERELRRTMSRYLSNEVIDRLMQDHGKALGGSSQVATTLFSDIRGFTSLSESLGAADTVAMLNEYFSYMEDVITNRSGMNARD